MKNSKEISKILNYLSIEDLDLKNDILLFKKDNIFYIHIKNKYVSISIERIIKFYVDLYDIDIMSYQININYQKDMFIVELIILELLN